MKEGHTRQLDDTCLIIKGDHNERATEHIWAILVFPDFVWRLGRLFVMLILFSSFCFISYPFLSLHLLFSLYPCYLTFVRRKVFVGKHTLQDTRDRIVGQKPLPEYITSLSQLMCKYFAIDVWSIMWPILSTLFQKKYNKRTRRNMIGYPNWLNSISVSVLRDFERAMEI